MFLRVVAKIQYLLTTRSFFLASRSTGIGSWPLLHNTWSLRGRCGNLWKFQKFTAKFDLKFLSTTHTPRSNFAVLLVHFADLHVDFVNKFWTRLTMKWPWREHEEARRLHITITFFSCLVVFSVFAFLLASAQVMYTSHRFRFIYLFRSYICIFTLCYVRGGFVRYGSLASKKYFFSAKWTRSEIFQLGVKTYSLRPLCALSFRINFSSECVHSSQIKMGWNNKINTKSIIYICKNTEHLKSHAFSLYPWFAFGQFWTVSGKFVALPLSWKRG